MYAIIEAMCCSGSSLQYLCFSNRLGELQGQAGEPERERDRMLMADA